MLNSQVLNDLVSVSRPLNAVAAGTTDQAGSGVDVAGYEGVMFIALFGALTATQVTSLNAQQSSDDGVADGYSDLEGTKVGPLADADGNKMLILTIHRPEKRYVKPVVDRGTANAVIDGVIAIRYGYKDGVPTSHASSVAFEEAHVTPAEGTP